MQHFVIGLYGKRQYPGGPYAVASAVHTLTNLVPFNMARTTVEALKTLLAASAVTANWEEEVAYEACLQRTLEKMYLKNIIANPLNDHPPAHVILPHDVKISIKHSVDPDHWIQQCAVKMLKHVIGAA